VDKMRENRLRCLVHLQTGNCARICYLKKLHKYIK